MIEVTSRTDRGIEAVNGVLVIDKPAGITSHDVVDRVRRLFRTKRVGHTGTLDPDATGVLVLCLGQATRLAEYLSASWKHYAAEVQFGRESDTLDASGSLVRESDASHLTAGTVEALLPAFRGKIEQVPPMVSARHHQGRRLYELAREGVVVERAPRAVEIRELELTQFVAGLHPIARLEITCSTGTYIRTLADDIGRSAGTGALMQTLRRTWVGTDRATGYSLDEAHTLERLQLAVDREALSGFVLPMSSAVREARQYLLTEDGMRRLYFGQSIPREDIRSCYHPASNADSAPEVVMDGAGNVCAVVRSEVGALRPVKVFVST